MGAPDYREWESMQERFQSWWEQNIHRYREGRKEHAEAYLDWLGYVQVPASSRVLDVGADDGWVREILPEGCRYVGIEPLERAAADFALARAMAEHLPIRSDSVGVVLLAEVLDHVMDPASVAAECWRVLSPGGILGIKAVEPPPEIQLNTWQKMKGTVRRSIGQYSPLETKSRFPDESLIREILAPYGTPQMEKRGKYLYARMVKPA